MTSENGDKVMGNTSTAVAEPPVSPTSGDISPAMPVAVPGEPVDSTALAAAGVGAGTPGTPVEGPGGGPVGEPGGGPGDGPAPTPSPTPGSTGGSGDGTVFNESEFAAIAGSNFLDLLKNATSPEALEARNIIMRRIALQGDVIPSRVPPPRNITEIGGYLNLLTMLNELDMRSQVLAGILGVAGPNPPLGWVGSATPLTFTPVLNDRPAGPAQPAIPVTILVRSDFAGPLRSALDALHVQGCLVPMMSGPLALPSAGAFANATLDPLDYLGRTLRLSTTSALSDPTMDALALVRAAGSSNPYSLAARSMNVPSIPVPTADYQVLQRGPVGTAAVDVTAASYVWVDPLLAEAGFVPSAPAIIDPSDADGGDWANYRNIGGLTVGTRLGDELHLLHGKTEIAGSALAAWQSWHWTGSEFAP